MQKYRVVIPYYYEFHVEAENEEVAIEQAHNQEGSIKDFDDDKAFVEEEA